MRLFINLFAMAAISLTASAWDVPENIYMVGGAAPADWNLANPTFMSRGEGNVFSWEGNLYANEGDNDNSAIKFLAQKGWDPEAYFAQNEWTEINEAGGTFTVVRNGEGDKKFKVTKSGCYKLTLTLDPSKADSEAGTLQVAYLGELDPEIYIIGKAVGISDRTKARRISGKNGVYTWKADLHYNAADGDQMQFILKNGDDMTLAVPTEVKYKNKVLRVVPGTYSYQESKASDAGGLKDWYWGLENMVCGLYTIVVNTNDRTIRLTNDKAYESYSFNSSSDKVYMLGLVNSAENGFEGSNSFDSGNPMEMERKEDGTFFKTVKLTYDKVDKNNENFNHQFKFCTGIGNWDQVYYLIPENADADHYVETVDANGDEIKEIKLKPNTNRAGHKVLNAFFGVPEGTDGKVYDITVDPVNLKLKLKANTNTGVKEINESDNAPAVFYRLDGVRLPDGVQPAPGIYILRKGDKVKKVRI